MAELPVSEIELIERFGPHLNQAPPGGWDTGLEIDEVVNTHCCFCGQQCGIKLKVHDNRVVGFEPWYEFPFNEGKLCPKGVKRYLQGSHPDRLLHPMERDPSAPGGFRRVTWEHALDRTVREIRRIQAEHGDDAFAMLSGVSLTNEKSYLIGKFARLALHTANLDYNGRYCMVSAGAANKKAFGIDRNTNPWSDIPLADVVWTAGTNIAETFPITTSYIWRARDRGAKLIVQDPRVVPHARTADLFLPVRPGTDSALFGAVLHELVRHDWLDHAYIDAHTVDFEQAVAAVAEMTPRWAADVTGVPAARIEQAAEWWGTSATGMLLHARGIEQQSKGTENVLAAHNLGLATGKFGKPGCGVSTITGQGNGQGGREHGQKCDQLPGARDIFNPDDRAYIAKVWGIKPDDLPGVGVDAYEIIRKIDRGEIRGLLSICFNPKVSLPDNNFVTRALEKLDHYVAIDFFLNETARHADVVLPGSLHEEDEGVVTQIEGRVIKINKAVECPGEARQDWRIIQDLAAALDRPYGFTFNSPREIFEELRVASRGGVADYSGITYEKIERQFGVFWPCPSEDHPGTPRLFEPGSWNPIAKGAGPFYFADGRARFNVADYSPPAEDVDEAYPLMLTTGRVVSQFLSGTQTRRIGPLVDQYPEPRIEMHPRLAEQIGVQDGDWVRAETRRGDCTLRALVVTTIRPDTIFIPYHWPGRKSANQLTISAQDPISGIPEYKVCAVRVRKADGPPDDLKRLEPQQG